MNILSLGGGVQSSTLLLMALAGETEKLDGVIFADTGNEPNATYLHLEYLKRECELANLPFYVVTGGNIVADTLRKVQGAGTRTASLPVYVRNISGSVGRLRRQCTHEYKILPIQRKVRELLPKREICNLWIGISLDEAHRMKDSRVKYIQHRFPLVECEPPKSRWDCIRWCHAHGKPIAPKSACKVCPMHDTAFWRNLKTDSPDEFAETADFDNQIRSLSRIDGKVYLHRSLIPLSEIDLSSAAEQGQMEMFGEECEGICGI